MRLNDFGGLLHAVEFRKAFGRQIALQRIPAKLLPQRPGMIIEIGDTLLQAADFRCRIIAQHCVEAGQIVDQPGTRRRIFSKACDLLGEAFTLLVQLQQGRRAEFGNKDRHIPGCGQRRQRGKALRLSQLLRPGLFEVLPQAGQFRLVGRFHAGEINVEPAFVFDHDGIEGGDAAIDRIPCRDGGRHLCRDLPANIGFPRGIGERRRLLRVPRGNADRDQIGQAVAADADGRAQAVDRRTHRLVGRRRWPREMQESKQAVFPTRAAPEFVVGNQAVVTDHVDQHLIRPEDADFAFDPRIVRAGIVISTLPRQQILARRIDHQQRRGTVAWRQSVDDTETYRQNDRRRGEDQLHLALQQAGYAPEIDFRVHGARLPIMRTILKNP